MKDRFAIGLDFGTNSARAIVVNTTTGEEIASSVFNFPTGDKGIVLDPKNPDLARQHPMDYIGAASGI